MWMAACHRLNQQSDAAIYVAFVDLEDRNKWLSSARNLKQQDGKVSLTLDLPPVIRPLKNELMTVRRALPSDIKQKSCIKYLKSYPYLQLQVPGRNPIYPKTAKETIAERFLEMDTKVTFSHK